MAAIFPKDAWLTRVYMYCNHHRTYNGGDLPTFPKLLNCKRMEHILHGGAIDHDHPVIFSVNKK